MTAQRRRGHEIEIFASERPPRLVLRFAIVLSVGLAIASALILLVVHRFAASQAERAATRHASLVASTLLQREIRRGDLVGPVSPTRRRSLDDTIRQLLPASDPLELSLVRPDGVITYSTDPHVIGAAVSGKLAAEAAGGTIVSRVGSDGSTTVLGERKALETYAPLGHPGGAALIVQPYAPIESAARSAQLRVGIVLEALLLALFLVFVPLLSRVTRKIQRQIDRIHFQAFYDGLTGLPNRAHLFESLAAAVRRASEQQRHLAVLVVDLDRFREINNTLGHETGDGLLLEVTNRLQAVCGSGLIARLGGDEFALVAEYEDHAEVTALAETIRSALEPSTVVNGAQLAVDSTIGIALFPKDGEDAATLLKHAEVATDTAKEWRVGILVYAPAVDPHDPAQLELVATLREAVEREELVIHYQPMVDVATGSVRGFEALTYWKHPSRGLLPPSTFIPFAERTGAIRHVTRAVLGAAVKQLEEWNDLDPNLTIAVNLAANDLLDTNLPTELRALLRKHQIAPHRLCIEVTERTVMAAPDRARAIIKRIVAAGVHISMDDFGTGYSSLAHLKNLPLHEVKIDRSFVSDLNVFAQDRKIVLAAIQLAHSLGLRVVAEGVESNEVHATLKELGCDIGQGYLYGRPRPAESAASALGPRLGAAA